MRICVFCGSSPGNDSAYADAARRVGQALADQGCELVYGGGRAGLMGIVADAGLAAGGKVIGVIPRALVDQEVAHTGLTQLLIVQTMHERKAKMAELSDGFIALPGGVGTLEEIFEQWGWAPRHGFPPSRRYGATSFGCRSSRYRSGVSVLFGSWISRQFPC